MQGQANFLSRRLLLSLVRRSWVEIYLWWSKLKNHWVNCDFLQLSEGPEEICLSTGFGPWFWHCLPCHSVLHWVLNCTHKRTILVCVCLCICAIKQCKFWIIQMINSIPWFTRQSNWTNVFYVNALLSIQRLSLWQFFVMIISTDVAMLGVDGELQWTTELA